MTRQKTVGDAEVLAIARDVFRARGHVVSTREIAKAVGLSEATLYQRFGTKDAMFFAAMGSASLDIAQICGTERTGKAALRGVLARLVGYFNDLVPTMLQVVTHPSFSAKSSRAVHAQLPHALIGGIAERIRRLSADGQLSGDPEAIAMWLVTAAHTLAHLEYMTGKGLLPERAESMVAVLWQGLKPREPRQ